MKKEQDKKELEKKISKEETSELEEEIKEDELKEIVEKISEKEIPKETNINKDQFREFAKTESTAPVLEEIAGEQELGGRVFFTPGMDANVQEDNEAFRYDIQAKEDEPKYHGDYSATRQNLEEIDITKVGRDIGQPQVREAGFVHSVEQTDSPMQAKYQEAKRIDMEKVGRENPFETKVQEVERKKLDYKIK